MEERLLAEMAWVRRLARALLRDGDAADDVAQDAWLVASKRAPDDRPLRPWLAVVVRNLVRMRGRSGARRDRRELASGDDTAVPTSAELVERVELQRVVAEEVIALGEPSRSTILLRYVEGLSSADIARRLGISDATVRKRLERALDELRERLRERDRAPAGGWLAALAPLAHAPTHVAIGVFTMKKLVAVIVAIVIALLVGTGVWHARAHRAVDDDTEVAGSGALATGPDRAGRDAARRLDAIVPLPSWAAQAGIAPRPIAGRVVRGDTPVADAVVRLGVVISTPGAGSRANLGSTPLLQVAVAHASAAGTFDFGLQPAAAFVVSAEAPDAAPGSISVRAADPQVATDHLVIPLADCRARLEGTVRDSAAGIPNARVRVAGLAGADTDAKGHYATCSAITPLTGITVEADGYGTIEMFLPSLYGELHQDFVLVPEATLGGVVVDEAGAPVVATVIAEPRTADLRHDTAQIVAPTDATGHFQLSRVAPGTYQLRATADHAATTEPTLVVATAGPAARELRLVVGARARLRGHVVTTGGAPAAGIEIMTDRTVLYGRSRATAISQVDGSFALDGVELGTVVLVTQPDEIQRPHSVVVDRVDPPDITIEVTPRATIRGHVTRHHEPVAGARVRCNIDERTGGLSDATGAYEIVGLPDGTGNVIANDGTAFGVQRGVTVARGSTQTVDIELAGGGQIRGTVVDEAGAAVPGVYVAFASTAIDDSCDSMTDATGAFVCTTLVGGGDYQPAVYPSASRQQRFHAASGDELARVHVPDGDTTVSDVRLAIAAQRETIHGKVLDDSGAIVPDAHVSAGGPEPGFLPIRARADGDGGFVVENLAHGTYTLRAHAPDGSEAEIAGVPTGATGVQIVVARPGRIDGTLAGFTAMPRVYAEQPLDDVDDPREAIVTGTTFTFGAVAPGRYTMSAMVAGIQVAGASVDVRSGQTAHVALAMRARAKVDGRITELATGAPIAGATCTVNISVDGSEAARPEVGPLGSQSDAGGHFTVDAAVGRARVVCKSYASGYSDAGGDFDVTGPTHVEVMAVKRTPSPSTVGFHVADWTVPTTVTSVEPGCPLAVGDQILAIDGASVANLVPDGVMTLARNHHPGSTLAITTQRGALLVPIH